jgi:hypothetical protein
LPCRDSAPLLEQPSAHDRDIYQRIGQVDPRDTSLAHVDDISQRERRCTADTERRERA